MYYAADILSIIRQSSGTMNKNTNRTKFAVGHFLTEKPDDPCSFTELARKFAPRLREVYFPWPGLSNARAKKYDKPDDEARITADLQYCRAHGMKLDILANATCYGEKSFTEEQRLQITGIIRHLDKIGLYPEIVTTTSPYIAKIFKTLYPDIEVRASVNMRLTTFQAFRYLAPLFDSYCLGRGQKGTLLYTVVKRGLYAHHPHGVEVDETTIRDFFCGVGQSSCARPVPGPQLAARLAEGPTK